jgi:hypothetical protein
MVPYDREEVKTLDVFRIIFLRLPLIYMKIKSYQKYSWKRPVRIKY